MWIGLQAAGWAVALAWVWRVGAAALGLPSIPDLLKLDADARPAGEPSLTVIVPARNEAKDLRACLESLLRQDYARLAVIAVDDRSTDATGAIMDALAAEWPERLRAIHVTELPPEWLGKTHAMALAARGCETDFLLFTDADVIFAPQALRRALAHAVAENADHLVLMPTTIIKRWDEAALLSFFQILGMWAVRLWRVADPRARRDAIGVGAFNLVRRAAYEPVGGYEALRMEIVEDLGIARRIKRAGLRQRVAFGHGLVSLHWASGAPGLIGVLTKNLFAAVGFRVERLLGLCGFLAVFCMLPFALVWVPGLRLPALVSLGAMGWAYRLMARRSGLSGWNALLAPFAAAVFCFGLLRSMITTLRQGGVIWRGTFYGLRELRRHVAPWP